MNDLQLCLDFICDFLQLLLATPNHLLVSQRAAAIEWRKCKQLSQNVYAHQLCAKVSVCMCVSILTVILVVAYILYFCHWQQYSEA